MRSTGSEDETFPSIDFVEIIIKSDIFPAHTHTILPIKSVIL